MINYFIVPFFLLILMIHCVKIKSFVMLINGLVSVILAILVYFLSVNKAKNLFLQVEDIAILNYKYIKSKLR